MFCQCGSPVRVYTTCVTWTQERAAFVQMIRDGKEAGAPVRGLTNGRWTAIWYW